jgi:Domain of unknown function (DUF4157)
MPLEVDVDRAPQEQRSTEPAAPATTSVPPMLGGAVAALGARAVQRKLVQRRLQREATAGADDAQVHGAADAGTRGASSELPHREAIQRSFGRHDVSGISAHTDAHAAAGARAMGAEAFATGAHVAFANPTPSLHTAAHEAAHVVQQRSGVSLKGGVGAAGDAHEQHADEVADLVVQGKSAEPLLDRHAGDGGQAAASPGAVQRQLIAYHQVTGEDVYVRNRPAVESVASKVDREVTDARAMALDWRNLLGHGNNHVKRWAQTAQEYFDNFHKSPDFIHARFGYAIEALACARLASQEQGLTVSKQVSHGGTRPDIVLSKDVDGEIAWLDITSSDSTGHIFGKDHTGWKTRPFVYEVVYEPLKLGDVLTQTPDPVYAAVGGFMAQKNQIAYEEQTTVENGLFGGLSTLRDDNEWTTGTGDAKTKKNQTRDYLNGLGLNLGRNNMQSTKGALKHVGLNIGPFGFNRGGVSQDTTSVRNWVGQKSQERTQQRVTELERSEMERICKGLERVQMIPLVGKLLAMRGNPTSETVKIAFSVEAGVRVLDRLRSLASSLTLYKGKEEGAKTFVGKISMHQLSFPETTEFDLMQKWTLDGVHLAEACDQLFDELYKRYGKPILPDTDTHKDDRMDVVNS